MPVIALPGFVVDSFVAPAQIDTGTLKTEEGSSKSTGEDAPPEDPAPKRASPLVWLGFRPGQFQAPESLGRLVSVRNVIPGHTGSRGERPLGTYRGHGRLERLVAEACCAATWMAVHAQSIRPNAPPGAAESRA